MDLPPPGSVFRATVFRWVVLLLISAAISVAFELLHLPAALLLGPMLAAILLGVNGQAVAMPRSAPKAEIDGLSRLVTDLTSGRALICWDK